MRLDQVRRHGAGTDHEQRLGVFAGQVLGAQRGVRRRFPEGERGAVEAG
jgi:hypothetical protein